MMATTFVWPTTWVTGALSFSVLMGFGSGARSTTGGFASRSTTSIVSMSNIVLDTLMLFPHDSLGWLFVSFETIE